MGRFNPDRYDVTADSSPDTADYRTGPDKQTALILRVPDGHCGCGCMQQPKGKNANFAMGHDIRLRGKLIRAHLSGRSVLEIRTNESGGEELSPIMTAKDVAARHSTDTFNWVEAIDRATATQGESVARKLDRANREVLARATGPQVGSMKVIKVGRWPYTGQVMAIYSDGQVGGDDVPMVEIEYVTKSGDKKTVRKPVSELQDA